MHVLGSPEGGIGGKALLTAGGVTGWTGKRCVREGAFLRRKRPELLFFIKI